MTYSAAFLLEKQIPVKIIDALGEAPESIKSFQKDTYLRGLNFDEIIEKIDPDTKLIGIPNLFTFAYPAVSDLCQTISQGYSDKSINCWGGRIHPQCLKLS